MRPKPRFLRQISQLAGMVLTNLVNQLLILWIEVIARSAVPAKDG
jgi:predicted membrane chloride channel (bestrophin family)